MSDLGAFLKARLVEDEQFARASLEEIAARVPGADHDQIGCWHVNTRGTASFIVTSDQWGRETDVAPLYGRTHGEHMARHDPTRVLAEVDAKRRILNRYLHAVEEAAKLREQYRGAARTGVNAAHLLAEAQRWDSIVRVREEPVKDLAAVYVGDPGYLERWKP